MENIFEYNGLEIPFDMEDSSDLARFEAAQDIIAKIQPEAEKAEKLSKKIEIGCSMYREAFTLMFGGSVADRIADKPTSLGSWERAFIAFMEYAMQCNVKVQERRQKLSSIANPKRDKRRGLNA